MSVAHLVGIVAAAVVDVEMIARMSQHLVVEYAELDHVLRDLYRRERQQREQLPTHDGDRDGGWLERAGERAAK